MDNNTQTDKIIDFAIRETLIHNPTFTNSINWTIYNNIVNPIGIKLTNFTRQNGAREKMKSISQKDLLQFVLNQAVKCYNAMMAFYYNDRTMKSILNSKDKLNYLLEVFPEYNEIQKAIKIIANQKLNSSVFYSTNDKDLLALVDAITQCLYQSHQTKAQFIEANGYGKSPLNIYESTDLFSKVEEDRKKSEVAENVRINRRAINKCLTEVMNGSQLKNQRNEYGLDGTLFATQDIGNRRHNQEDSVLIMTHPDNPDFKLLVVSDGMGSVELGEKASQYACQELAKWFQTLPKDYFYYPLELQTALNQKIVSISNEIYTEYNQDYRSIRSGATLSTAIVTEDNTIISNVGDSRVYSVSRGKLQLLTKDESIVWPLGKKPSEVSPKVLDDLRFDKENNKILRCLGEKMSENRIQTLITPNTSYDRLLLMTDGVTDLLSQDKIRILSTISSREEVTKLLVEEALKNDAIRKKGADEYHNGVIPAGKDNASAAMYARR